MITSTASRKLQARTVRQATIFPAGRRVVSSQPHSIASGILDDETYDWFELVQAMQASGGRPLVASEDRLREANWLAHQTTDIAVSNTGTAGLAGLLGLRPEGRSLVLFTGLRRSHG